MKNKGVIILGGAVVVLGLYAYFGEYKREINEEKKKEVDSKIITLQKDQIQKIDLKKGDGVLISLQRTVDGWDVVAPVKDQGDNEVIGSFLDQITGEKATDTITPKSTDLSEYGFKPSLGTVTLTNNTNQSEKIEISSKKNFEGLVYLKKENDPKILTSSQTWTTFLTKPADQFRNLRLFRGSISKVNSIRLTNKNGMAEFKNNDGFWFSPQKTDWKLDQNAIREIVTQASTVKGSSVIADTKPFGPVGAHLLTLEFQAGKDTWKGLLHQDTKSKDVIAALSPTRLIIRFPPQTLEELRSKKLIDFRDKTEPFQFDRAQVQKIVAKSKIKTFTVIKQSDGWHLDKPDNTVVVNSATADDLVKKLSRLTVYRYLETQPAKPALDSQVQLYSATGELLFQISWSDFKDHEGYAQTNKFKEVFQLDDAQVNQLMLPEVVKAKPETRESQKVK